MVALEEMMEMKFSVSCFIVYTDAGLASADNRKANSTGGRAYITVASIKKMRTVMQEWALRERSPCTCRSRTG